MGNRDRCFNASLGTLEYYAAAFVARNGEDALFALLAEWNYDSIDEVMESEFWVFCALLSEDPIESA